MELTVKKSIKLKQKKNVLHEEKKKNFSNLLVICDGDESLDTVVNICYVVYKLI